MYHMNLQPYDKSSQVYKLVNELIKAKERGVDVQVILDQNVDFVSNKHKDKWVAQGKNAWSFRALKEAGIDVWYDNLTTYTHAKTVVIDKEVVIIGSANWSKSVLNKNAETNVLIRSSKLARELLTYFDEIKIDKKASHVIPDTINAISISWAFLENPKLAGRMMAGSDERAFDLYMLLLKEFDGNSEAKIALDYDKMAGYLGIQDRMTRIAYRRQITKTLRKLEKRYKLIKVKFQYAKDAVVALLDYKDPKKPYSVPKEWYFQIPDNFWEYGWNKKLSHSTKQSKKLRRNPF